MSDIVEEFNEYRSKMNEKLLADNNKILPIDFRIMELQKDTACQKKDHCI